ncbi:MAG: P22 phage major capsid protein family protein [Alphaproteobacteria bacterium]|nr:P22 phage major capsid protein family protein [Alphaproteobacteria bacterium]
MSNTLGNYDPIFYAQEALIALNKTLGMAGRVHRGYDPNPQQKGSVINITRPSVFEATNVNTSTGGTTQALTPENVSITLDTWKEVKFALTDKELTFTKDKIINDHIAPAAYALADAIDLSLVGLYAKIPWKEAISSTPVVTDITGVRKALFNNKAPMNDLHFMVDGSVEAGLLALSAFATADGAGNVGVDTQLRGSLGTRYGFEFFANQNTPAHTSGTMADTAGALNADAEAGAVEIVIKSLTDGQTLKAGDIITITGDAQQYVVTADKTISSATTVAIYPALAQKNLADAVVTVVLPSGTGATKNQCLAFHRHAFALAMAPLSDMGGQLGARVATVSDPVTNLSIRSRIWYEGNTSTVKVGLDALWGVQVLNPNLAVRAVQ